MQALLKLLQGGRKAAPGKENQDGGGAAEGPEAKAAPKKRKGQSRALQRPLIAICNDLYVPALRPLRAAAKILHFSQPQVSEQWGCIDTGGVNKRNVVWSVGDRGLGMGLHDSVCPMMEVADTVRYPSGCQPAALCG